MNIRNIPTWLGLLAALYLVTACDRVNHSVILVEKQFAKRYNIWMKWRWNM